MELNNIILFIVLSFFIGIIPGPSTMFVLYSSLRYGAIRSYYAAGGQLLAFTIFFLIAALSIEWLTESISNSLQYLKYAGGIYLCYMAFGLYRSKNDMSSNKHEIENFSRKRLFNESLMVGLSNPKAIIYYSLILPQFIIPDYSLTFQLTLLFILDIVLGLLIVIIYTYGAVIIKKLATGIFIEKYLNRITAAVLVTVAVLMLIE